MREEADVGLNDAMPIRRKKELSAAGMACPR
jgi:hypothetical protein